MCEKDELGALRRDAGSFHWSIEQNLRYANLSLRGGEGNSANNNHSTVVSEPDILDAFIGIVNGEVRGKLAASDLVPAGLSRPCGYGGIRMLFSGGIAPNLLIPYKTRTKED